MKDPYVLFWFGLILASIVWYGFLVFYLGIKAGREILDLMKELGVAHPKSPPADRK